MGVQCTLQIQWLADQTCHFWNVSWALYPLCLVAMCRRAGREQRRRKKRITEMQGDRLLISLKSGHRLLAEGKNTLLGAGVLSWDPSSGKGVKQLFSNCPGTESLATKEAQ